MYCWYRQVVNKIGIIFTDAHIAQLVEHILGKNGVFGSNPNVGSE
jgi:hypothetical protein